MVDTLGASVFPYLPKALGPLLADSEVKVFGYIFVCKCNTPMVVSLTGIIIGYLFVIFPNMR